MTTDPLRFAEACGAWAPLDLRVHLTDGTLLAEGVLDGPSAILGNSIECDVTLTAPEVSARHAVLQVIQGRVIAVDLGSRTGVFGLNGRVDSTWVETDSPVGIGPFHLSLRGMVGESPLIAGNNPLLPNAERMGKLPRVIVQFLKGKAGRAEWPVSRELTFVGKAEACKLGLTASDVADFHCYFLLTPRGLWVVDLLAEGGIKVNGELVRLCLLGPADVLEVGRFRLGFGYPDGMPEPATTPFPWVPDSLPVMTPPRHRGLIVTLPGPSVLKPPETGPATQE